MLEGSKSEKSEFALKTLYCICINIMYKINMRTIYTLYNAHVHCTLYQMYNYIYSNMTI